jgi:hypothetical protein
MESRAGLRLALALAASVVTYSASAGEVANPVGVVELFTSQGCSSCPPADKILSELATAGEVVALAYHVDYWDYLGWQDTLASPDNTQRQNEYRQAFDARSVYTPQAVINGRTHLRGADRDAIRATLRNLAASGQGMSVGLRITQAGDRLIIDVGAAKGTPSEAHVVLVSFSPKSVVAIERGENSGSTVTYWNAVSSMQTAGMWHGKPARFELPLREVSKKGSGGCAVLLQSIAADGLPGPILGAALVSKANR